MRAIPHNPYFDTLPLGEKLFLELWYNLTHPGSGSSFRIRLHTGRTILHELEHEVALGLCKPEEIAEVAAEALEICAADSELKSSLGASWTELESLLKTQSQKVSDISTKRLRYILTDVMPKLSLPYLRRIFLGLEDAILLNREAEIFRLANSLASELASRGWAVAGLHSWAKTYFLVPPKDEARFVDRFRAFAFRVQQPEQPYTATISISGSSELRELKSFCGFVFSADGPAIANTAAFEPQALAKFLRPNPQKTYATVSVTAVDHSSAAQVALDSFAVCQDRLRFNFSKEPVLNDGSRVLVTRSSDKKHRLVAVGARMPSLEHHLPPDKFLRANLALDRLFSSNQLDPQSQMRIQAAVRHYRLGLDGRSYQDMFQHWWLGLETLTNLGDGGGIGVRVIKNSIALLTHRHFQTWLINLSRAVSFVCREWPREVIAIVGGDEKQQLKWWNLIKVLQDQAAATAVADKLNARPWIRSRWERARILVNDPALLVRHLDNNRQLVNWQLQRIYRIRCCIVHGTPVKTALQLPTSHLEYYLREAIYVVLIAIGRGKQIQSISAVIERTEYCAERRRRLLSEKNINPATVRTAIDEDFIFSVIA